MNLRLISLCLGMFAVAGYAAFTDVRVYQQRKQILQLQRDVDRNRDQLLAHKQDAGKSFSLITQVMNKIILKMSEEKR